MKSLVKFINESMFKISKSKIKNIGDTKNIIKDICNKTLEENDYLIRSTGFLEQITEFVTEICKLNNIELPEVIKDNIGKFLTDDVYEIFDELIDLDDNKVYNPTKSDIINLAVSILNNIE